MSVKISLRVTKKKDSQDGRNTDNESKGSGSIKDNRSDRNKSTKGRRKGEFDGSK